ncbi:long-chain acyl-CoA synthetase [Rhizobiales bacterium GAS191]|nr:long-chain acyl-CoA synthetase [Rhizobiales bacterium GAS188]SEF15600.1 long-chain acyl-CoA synthetase [Rhizobiales bacterium GAS191]
MANLADHLFRQARERGGAPALIFEDRVFSYAEMADRVRRIAGGLATAGIGVGTRVGLLMQSRPDFIFHQQALFALGAIVSPLNVFYKRSELTHAIGSCDLEFLIVGRGFLENLPSTGAPGTGSLKRVLIAGPAHEAETDQLASTERLMDRAYPIAGPVSLPENTVGLMLNTSATTGKAKGVMLSIANIRANYDSTPGWLGIVESSVILCALPLYNTFGLNQCINALMVTGATMVLMERFDAGRCLDAIETHRCTFFPAVPTMLQKLFDHPDASHRDMSSISRIMTGAAPVPAALLERIYAAMGEDTLVMTGYGLTEATAIVSLEHIQLDANGKVLRPKSIGRALPGIEMKIVADSGREAAAGEVGEICVRGPNVMQGYYKMPEETAVAIVDGWLRTGDLGIVDEEGHAYIVDRKKEVIIRGGQNIYPADIEEVIYHHPGVSEVAVVGAPDERLGEVPVAFVALKPSADVSGDALIERCREELAHYKVPTAVYFLPELPKGPTGKILRRGLRAP